MDWGRKRLLDFNAGKFTENFTGANDVKVNGSILEKISSFKMLGVDFLFQIGLGLLHYLYC